MQCQIFFGEMTMKMPSNIFSKTDPALYYCVFAGVRMEEHAWITLSITPVNVYQITTDRIVNVRLFFQMSGNHSLTTF